uniref:Uncharacterized protein n=1 Tax=Lactuca sativa TaxID=4236 RepID=A0A9R1WLY4_LACSA|nr:hypothetical protein LSAT_V11C900488470 [Lactuca sativa]
MASAAAASAAPKITIPTEYCPDNLHPTKLLLDLGNLIIRTQDDDDDDDDDVSHEKDIYLQFGVVLSVVSAFFVDGDYHWSQRSLTGGFGGSSQSSIVSFLPIIDKCGVTCKLQQGEDNDNEGLAHPWDQADIEGWLDALNWKGVGNRKAVWQRRYFLIGKG